jgi:ethanolamine utilization protein EutQ (cupin superfamily)
MNDENKVELVGKALGLAELVDYQPGSVVSRTLIKKKAGTITLFAFDEGEGLSVNILEGQAQITISGKPSRLQEGQIIIMPANKPHALGAVTRFKMMLVMIRS